MKGTLYAVLLMIINSISGFSAELAYVKLHDNDYSTNKRIIEFYGGTVRHAFPPNEFICKIDKRNLLLLAESIKCEFDNGIDQKINEVSSTVNYEAFLNLSSLEIAKFSKEPDTMQPVTPWECGFTTIYAEESSKNTSDFIFPDRKDMFNANYMVGEVAVCVMLMESQGSGRNWELTEQDTAIIKIVQGLDHLSEIAENYNVPLKWVYEIHTSVPTSFEPIQTDFPERSRLGLTWDFGWIDEAMDYLGQVHEWDGTHDNANRMRSQYNTDWGITLFMVKNLPNEAFPTGSIGYSKRYGYDIGSYLYESAFTIMGYNSGYTALYTNQIVAHEVAHLFGPPDEYANAPTCSNTDDCSKTYGYLNHPNANCQACGSSSACLMLSSDYYQQLCTHTLRHLGWSDSDGDGHPDAIDPNSSRWATLHFVNPGDLVRIFTLDGDFVRAISVTENKMDTHPTGNTILWDCLNYDSQPIGEGTFLYYTINDNPPQTLSHFTSNPSIKPNVYGASFANDPIRDGYVCL